MKHFIRTAVTAFFCIAGPITQAADFDGTKALICAPVEAMDCVAGEGCARGIPEDIGAPAFMRIDFAKKVIVGPKRTSPIRSMDKSGGQLLLQGIEVEHVWVLALDAQGKMTATLANSAGAFVLFGSCTPL
jgi:hypothetical protein